MLMQPNLPAGPVRMLHSPLAAKQKLPRFDNANTVNTQYKRPNIIKNKRKSLETEEFFISIGFMKHQCHEIH